MSKTFAPFKHTNYPFAVSLSLLDQIKGAIEEHSPTEQIKDSEIAAFDVNLFIKRDDLIHPIGGGNKWRKLRHNLTYALNNDHHTLLTFGGAFSNHIAATALAAKGAGLDAIGVIRGDDDPENPTLKFAREQGMVLHFVTRDTYAQKEASEFLRGLHDRFGRFHAIPEGGANGLGVKGCADILDEIDVDFDVVCCACGTGTTLAGLTFGLQRGQSIIGFPALKGGDFLKDRALALMAESGLKLPRQPENLISINPEFHFGGYAKIAPTLLDFIARFTQRTGIPLDPIYTGKMMFGIYELIKRGGFAKGTKVLVYHSGGAQGWAGLRYRGIVY